MYTLLWLFSDIHLLYMGVCYVAVYVEVSMKKGDLVRNIKTNNFYLIINISRLSNRDWVYVEPVCEGLSKWDRAKNFRKVIRV